MRIKFQYSPGGSKIEREVAGKTQKGFIVYVRKGLKPEYEVVPFDLVVEEKHEKPTLMGPT